MAGDAPTSTAETDDADPRCSKEYVRTVESVLDDPGGTGVAESNAARSNAADHANEVTIVGVVHDHPASVYRARTVAAEADPDVLALELPPLAVSLFERYADDDATPPAIGGEMSAAIQACDAERIAGIDGPSLAFGARLGSHLLAERPSFGTVRRALGRFGRAAGHAVTCRAASVLAATTARLPDCSARREHAVTAEDPPDEQADDEARQVRLARSVAAAFGADRAVATRDETREAHMAARLASLATAGDVVAVVGIDHIVAVADRLQAA